MSKPLHECVSLRERLDAMLGNDEGTSNGELWGLAAEAIESEERAATLLARVLAKLTLARLDGKVPVLEQYLEREIAAFLAVRSLTEGGSR